MHRQRQAGSPIRLPRDAGNRERFGGKFEAHCATKAAPGSFSHFFVPPSIQFDQTQKLADVERTYRIAPPGAAGLSVDTQRFPINGPAFRGAPPPRPGSGLFGTARPRKRSEEAKTDEDSAAETST